MKQRCIASSWRGEAHGSFGPGGYNRCVYVEGHAGPHLDDWGNEFVQEPFKVLHNIKSKRGART